MSSITPVANMQPSKFRAFIVDIARKWLDTPYRHNASLKGVGADCLGLLRGVYKELYGFSPAPPAYTPDWGETPDSQGNFPEPLLSAAKLYLGEKSTSPIIGGDVILFRLFDAAPIKHCAITTSATTMIHAYSNHQVCEVPIGYWWKRHITHCFAFRQSD